MSTRPTVSVFSHNNASEVVAEVRMPHVFLAPIRNDLVSFVHDQLSCNTRQAHGVNKKAGMKHSAESWGTGRAVARIPRVSGSGTHRSGQGAFGNMCRKGRMAHPLHTWRKWHRKVNMNQRRHALASAVAATACAPLVMARGHRVSTVPQLPLILDDTVGQISKTRDVIAMLKNLGVWDDVRRVMANKGLRAGKGKMRDRRHKWRRGPLFVVDEGCESLRRALRNVPGCDFCNVNRLNIRQLAPGGHLGRFCIWTKSAFSALEKHFGSGKGVSSTKRGYRLQNDVVTSADMNAIINSDAIQSVLVEKKAIVKRTKGTKPNPLRNRKAMAKLNPYSVVLREARKKTAGVAHKITKADRKAKSNRNKGTRAAFNSLLNRVDTEVDNLTNIYRSQIASMNIK
jgi:large subunit ribosomal protein L4e